MIRIIIKEAKEFFRSPPALFMALVFPVLLVFLLGNLLQNLDYSDYEIGEIKIHCSADYAESADKTAFEEFLKSADIIKYEWTDDAEKSLALVDSGELSAVIKLSQNEIILHTGSDTVKNRALSSMLNSYLTISDTYKAVISENPVAIGDIIDMEYKTSVEAEGLGITRSMIDYYAVAMLVMIIFMACSQSSIESFRNERNLTTMARMVISPTGRISIFLGKVLGALPMIILQTAVAMICSVLFFGAKYCDNAGDNLLLAVMFIFVSLAVSAVSTLLGLMINAPGSAIAMPLSWSMLLMSGSYSKEIFIEGFSEHLPPYIIQQAAFDLTLFKDNSQALTVITVCGAIFLVFTLLGAFVFSKKKYV